MLNYILLNDIVNIFNIKPIHKRVGYVILVVNCTNKCIAFMVR